ncbi:hypothetical protein BDD12DRAFT_900210 [Trichophaea hybrida]|nr:hypothetical protein BDD12DRAFT_900210 [Trichophaea hybrida]
MEQAQKAILTFLTNVGRVTEAYGADGQGMKRVEKIDKMGHVTVTLEKYRGKAIAALRRFANTAQTALSTAQIKTIVAEDIKKRYNGKTAAKTDRRVITKARMITAEEVIKLRNAKLEKERLAYEKAIAKKTRQPKVPKQARKKQAAVTISTEVEGAAAVFLSGPAGLSDGF